MSNEQDYFSPNSFYDLVRNINNEIWSAAMSQFKLINVSQQLTDTLLMNSAQKDYQIYKEQVAILENMLEKVKDNQQQTIKIFQDIHNETMEKLMSLSMSSKS